MYIVYYGINSSSDIKLAQESGFHAVGGYCSANLSEEALRSLFHNLPAFMGSYITTSLHDYSDICRLVKATQCHNICLLDTVPNSIIERLKIAFPQLRVLEQYRYLKTQSNEIYRNQCSLSIADGLVINFRDFNPYQLTPELDLRELSEFCDLIKKPVIFSGFLTIQQAEIILTKVRSYGVIIEKSIFKSSGMTAHEALYNLSKTHVKNAANGMSSEHKIYKPAKIPSLKSDKFLTVTEIPFSDSINSTFKAGDVIPDDYLPEISNSASNNTDKNKKISHSFYESG